MRTRELIVACVIILKESKPPAYPLHVFDPNHDADGCALKRDLCLIVMRTKMQKCGGMFYPTCGQ